MDLSLGTQEGIAAPLSRPAESLDVDFPGAVCAAHREL